MFPRLKTGKRRRQMYRVYWDSWPKTGTTVSLSSGEAGALEEQPLPERISQVEREWGEIPSVLSSSHLPIPWQCLLAEPTPKSAFEWILIPFFFFTFLEDIHAISILLVASLETLTCILYLSKSKISIFYPFPKSMIIFTTSVFQVIIFM